jgi:general secretion pathway protein D
MHLGVMRITIALGILGAFAGAVFGQCALLAAEASPPADLPAAESRAAGQQFTLNFREAPLDTVLDYFASAAGFIINKEDSPSGTIELKSEGAVTRAEAVQLLNTALKKNGHTAWAKGKILTVRRLDTAKTADLEVLLGSNPDALDRSDEIVTQVIPVRFASCTQLLNNLQPLLPLSATLSANESANSLILVATKTDVRRMVKIISLLDSSIATVSCIKVFILRYADAKQLATVCQQLFASQTSSSQGGGSSPGPMAFNFQGSPPGMPGGLPGMFGGGGGNAGGASQGSSSTGARSTRLVAAADETSNSLIVSAPADALVVVSNVVQQLDQPAASMTELRAFQLKNADPSEVADQLATLFADNSNSSSGNNSPVQYGGGPPGMGGPMGAMGFGGGPFGQAGTDATRASKRGRVIAVPDPRSSTLLVSADSALMPHIERLIQQLDSNPARKEVVQVFDLQNAGAAEISQVLQDLFSRNTSARRNSANQNNSNSDPLLSRETQQHNAMSGAPGFGNFGGGGGAGSSGGGGQTAGR